MRTTDLGLTERFRFFHAESGIRKGMKDESLVEINTDQHLPVRGQQDCCAHVSRLLDHIPQISPRGWVHATRRLNMSSFNLS